MRRVIFVLFATLSFPTHTIAQQPVAWPQFRGPEGKGVATDAQPLPVHFGPEKNVLWKVALPAGFSSPCIWGDHLFLTGYDAREQKLETLCLERATGKIRWRRTAPAEKIEGVYKVNSPASATPATDGERVYVSIGSFGLLCYDFEGKELWRRPLPRPPVSFGTATSPIVSGDLVLINSQGKDLHVLAVKAKTGETVWQTQGSPFPSAYPVPALWKQNAVTEVIVPGKGGLVAYDLKDGSRRWWLPGLSPESNTSPLVAAGMLYVASHLPGGDPDQRMKLPAIDEFFANNDKNKDGKLSRQELPTDVFIFSRGGKEGVGDLKLHMMFWLFDRNGDGHIDQTEYRAVAETPFNNALLAIRPGGQKDISQSHIAWQYKRGIPEVPSPLEYQGRIYMVRNGGILTCLDAKTGKDVFPQQRLSPGGLFYASPVAGDGKVYLASDTGVVIVLKAGETYEVLAENDFGEVIRATPALVEGKMYLRTAGHLYALQEPRTK